MIFLFAYVWPQIVLAIWLSAFAFSLNGCAAAPPGEPCAGSFMCIN